MSVGAYLHLLDIVICNLRAATRTYLLMTALFFLIGCALSVFLFTSMGVPDCSKTVEGLLGAVGVFIASLASFPLKRFFDTRERIAILRSIHKQLTKESKRKVLSSIPRLKTLHSILNMLLKKGAK